jgi:hypothetical protein
MHFQPLPFHERDRRDVPEAGMRAVMVLVVLPVPDICRASPGVVKSVSFRSSSRSHRLAG